jgi:hypothetical protein
MSSGSPKAPGKLSLCAAQDNPSPVIVIRSVESQQRFVAKSLETLELLGQHQDRYSDAVLVMDAGFQIESEAIELGYRAIAAAARSLSTQAAELFLRSYPTTESITIKGPVDLLSVLLLRVYLTGTDVDSMAESVTLQVATARSKSTLRCVH